MASKLSASERARVSEYLTDSTAEHKWGHTPCWKEVKTDPEYEARYKQFSPDARDVIASTNRLGHDQFLQRVQAMKEVREMLGPDAKKLNVPNQMDEWMALTHRSAVAVTLSVRIHATGVGAPLRHAIGVLSEPGVSKLLDRILNPGVSSLKCLTSGGFKLEWLTN